MHQHPEGLVQGIAEVEEMFSHNIVQGKLNDQGNYGTHTFLVPCLVRWENDKVVWMVLTACFSSDTDRDPPVRPI